MLEIQPEGRAATGGGRSMTHERQQPGQVPGDSYPSSTQVPSNTNPEPIREPWDPRREPQGAPMPWEKDTATRKEPEQPPKKR
jgi:hypothetical protein